MYFFIIDTRTWSVMTKLVSIVIPVYNGEKYIEKALNSCLNQTYSNIEIIAIDDGSTDNTPEVLQNYSDRINVITQKNKGIAGALNMGIGTMKSNLYKLMNADDVLYPDCIENLVSEFRKIPNEKVIIYGNYDLIDSKDNIIGERIEINRNAWSQYDQSVALLDYQFVNCITTIFPKNIFQNYGLYNESVRFSEDYELLLRLSLLHGFRFHLIEKKLAKYRLHPEQDTKRKMEEGYNYSSQLRKSILKKLEYAKRKELESALSQFKKRNKTAFSLRTKETVRNLMFKFLPEPTARKVRKTYRKLRYRKTPEN